MEIMTKGLICVPVSHSWGYIKIKEIFEACRSSKIKLGRVTPAKIDTR